MVREVMASSDGVAPGVIPFDPVKYAVISAFSAIAWYNVIEINAQVFLTFKRHRGLYFWALLITSWGIAVHVLSFILKFFIPRANWVLCATLTTLGWYPMVTGQSIVLYSRLHLVVRDPRILRFVLIMIIADVFLFHVPTTVMTFGTDSPHWASWQPKFNIMERLQMTAFMFQEVTISGIYVWATLKLLKPIYHARTRKVMMHLIWINMIIIGMDIILLVMEYTNNYEIQASLKPMVYSIKLKLEFTVLNQLMVLANAGLSHGARDDSQSPHEKHRHGSRSTERRVRTPALNRHNCIVKTQDISVSSEKADVESLGDVTTHGGKKRGFLAALRFGGGHNRLESREPSRDRGRPSGPKTALVRVSEISVPPKPSQDDSLSSISDFDPYGIGSIKSNDFRAIASLEERERRAEMRANGGLERTISIPKLKTRSSMISQERSITPHSQLVDPFGNPTCTTPEPTSERPLQDWQASNREDSPRPSVKASGGETPSSTLLPVIVTTEPASVPISAPTPQPAPPIIIPSVLPPTSDELFARPITDATYTARAWRGSVLPEAPPAVHYHSSSKDSTARSDAGSDPDVESVWGVGPLWPQPPPVPADQGLPGLDWRRPSVNDFGKGDEDDEDLEERLAKGNAFSTAKKDDV